MECLQEKLLLQNKVELGLFLSAASPEVRGSVVMIMKQVCQQSPIQVRG